MSDKMNRMIRKAQEMERRVEEIRRELGKRVFEGEAEGVVKVTVNGDHEVLAIKIDETEFQARLAEEGDQAQGAERLAELVRKAVNHAIQQSKTVIDEEMRRATQGLSLPGI
jgi:DNA-binding YbaB/EbfC family protein